MTPYWAARSFTLEGEGAGQLVVLKGQRVEVDCTQVGRDSRLGVLNLLGAIKMGWLVREPPKKPKSVWDWLRSPAV